MVKVEDTISAENTFSDAAEVVGPFNFSLSGTWSATVHLQRRFGSDGSWMDVESFTANAEKRGYEPEGDVYYRFGVKSGNYTSGDVAGRISQ